ncbi:AT-rich interactive domain-containing protein 5A [Eucyclogobius newberryi]|uniref:AT-rich interactive domain-containing protein 5A n=1 Tax=Eucyclogobius newberryi TaxID=166745 RepID=UPI003B59F310
MAENEANETHERSDDNDESICQTQISVIEIPDSSNELDEETRSSSQMEEKAFISGLHSYMRHRGTPIERIPHLGFKQINLWLIYKAVEKLGGYDSVTTKRLWKRVYDELGGSPGSTSAATCTRKHYERLILPYERHNKGEDDKPLPQTKPRKPYKRNADGKVDKPEGKKKRSHVDRDTGSQLRIQRNDLVLRPLSSMWTVPSDKLNHSKQTSDLSIYDLPRVLPVRKTHTWTPPVPPGAGISPLEKKKRMAQASLCLRLSPQDEESQRPSVILCSSPGPAFSARAFSDGSPQPQSSSSSRSTSPLSVSSEDSSVTYQNKPSLDVQLNCSRVKGVNTGDRERQESKEITTEKTEGNSQPATKHLAKDFEKDRISNWMPVYKGTHFTPSFPSSSSSAKYDLARASTSGFTKVVPKPVQLLRPSPIRLGYKIHQTLQLQEDSLTKKQNSTSQRTNQTEKGENSQSRLCKAPLFQHSLVHNLHTSCAVPSYNKSVRAARPHTSFHPAFLPNRMRLPHAQLMYRQVPVNPGHPAIIGPVVYPFSCPISYPGYTLNNVMPIYPHKL